MGLSRGVYIYALEKDFCVIQCDLDTWPTKFIQDHCTPFDNRQKLNLCEK